MIHGVLSKQLETVFFLSAKPCPEQELVIKDLYWRISKKYTVAFNYRECEIELAAISIASYYCNDVFGKDVCNLFLKDENTFSLG